MSYSLSGIISHENGDIILNKQDVRPLEESLEVTGCCC